MTQQQRMPAVFIGHGSPMNAIEDNIYTQAWEALGRRFPTPKAILMISAHWMTRGVAVTAMKQPQTIHDFGGFPQALFDIRYPAPGDPALAQRIAEHLAPLPVVLDQQWGLDHGTWSVLVKMYPQAQIPVLQLSLDLTQPASWHFDLGRRLAVLRDEGIMLMASGNVVHNLRQIALQSPGFDWAHRFNDVMRNAILEDDTEKLVNYQQLGQDAALSVPTSEHFLPLLYVMGSKNGDDQTEIVVDGIDLGAIGMMTVLVS